MATYKGKVTLIPEWEYKPNTVLEIIYYTTSSFTFNAQILSGPGITKVIPFKGDKVQMQKVNLPNGLKPGDQLTYKFEITTNSPVLNGQVVDNVEMGVKPNGSALTYQGFVFTNDAGDDNDWNDCVINFALYNHSND